MSSLCPIVCPVDVSYVLDLLGLPRNGIIVNDGMSLSSTLTVADFWFVMNAL